MEPISERSLKDIYAGFRQGRWLVIAFSHKDKCYDKFWYCKCACGTERLVSHKSLKYAKTKSCGCLTAEKAAKSMTTHGMSSSPECSIWYGLIDRCKNHEKYAGRGIKVCARWLESFENFYADMGPRPSNKHSVERRDNAGNYSPENCYWGTPRQQANNRGTNANGLPLGVFARENQGFRANIRQNGKSLNLGTYKTKEDAATAYDNKCEDWGEGRPNGTTRNAKPLERTSRRYRNAKNGMPIGVVLRSSGRFGVYISINKKTCCLGTFDTKEEAATVYDDKCEQISGERPNGTKV